jgi:predicted nucleotidyltransferase
VRTTGPGQSALLILDVVEILTHEKVDYAVIGAMAASIHGVVRASLDVDAVLLLTVQQAAGLEKKLQQAGLATDLRRGDPEDPIPALLRLSDVYRNRVDLLIGLRGLEAEAFARALSVPFKNFSLRIIGREDFIAMKVFAGSPQDLADARAALAAANQSIDLSLVRRLAKRYGRDASAALEKLLSSPPA